MRNGLGYALQPMRQYALRRVWHFTTDEQIAHTCETLCIGNSVQSFFNGTLRISGTATTSIVGSTAQEAYPHGQGLSFIFHSGRPRPCTADRKIRRHNCQDRSLAEPDPSSSQCAPENAGYFPGVNGSASAGPARFTLRLRWCPDWRLRDDSLACNPSLHCVSFFCELFRELQPLGRRAATPPDGEWNWSADRKRSTVSDPGR